MKAIQLTCEKNPCLEDAQDQLHGLSHMPGFVFGYVDDKENRVVAFFLDTYPDSALVPGQRRRDIVFAHEELTSLTSESDLAALARAIGKDGYRAQR
jgi:hypothetical protein